MLSLWLFILTKFCGTLYRAESSVMQCHKLEHEEASIRNPEADS